MSTIAREILRACSQTTNLAFANSKSRIELLADELKTAAASAGLSHEVVVHHGSLSKEEREHAEARLRAGGPCTAVCSNTLEMGIDIGSIDSVIQVSAPWSVAALVQRVGRSGRRGNDAVLRGYFTEERSDSDSDLWKRLHLDFVRGVAVIQLMLPPFKFIESPDPHRAHRSTLIHQLLSTLAETGGLPAADLHGRLMRCGAFGELSPTEFALLLRALASRELISQMAQGDLVLGRVGESLRDHFSFYAAFKSPDELRVVHGSQEIRRLPADLVPPPGEHIILAGRRWQIVETDLALKQVFVTPSHGRRPPFFIATGIPVHGRIHAAMRQVLCSSEQPAYLDATANEILAHARSAARSVHNFQPAVQPGELARTRVFLWAGSKVQLTLRLALIEHGLKVHDERVGMDVECEVDALRSALEKIASAPPDRLRLAAIADEVLNLRLASPEKFDEYVPKELWATAFAADQLDVEGALETAKALLSAR